MHDRLNLKPRHNIAPMQDMLAGRLDTNDNQRLVKYRGNADAVASCRRRPLSDGAVEEVDCIELRSMIPPSPCYLGRRNGGVMGRTVGRQGRRAWTRRSLGRICRDAASLHASDSAIVALTRGAGEPDGVVAVSHRADGSHPCDAHPGDAWCLQRHPGHSEGPAFGSYRTSSRRRLYLNVVPQVRPILPDTRFCVAQFALAVFSVPPSLMAFTIFPTRRLSRVR